MEMACDFPQDWYLVTLNFGLNVAAGDEILQSLLISAATTDYQLDNSNLQDPKPTHNSMPFPKWYFRFLCVILWI